MSGTPAGRLSIEIVAEIARLQTDLDKAKREVKRASQDIGNSAKAANDNLSRIGKGAGAGIKEYSRDVARLKATIDPAWASLERYKQQVDLLRTAQKQGAIGQAQYIQQIRLAKTEYQNAGRGIVKTSGAMTSGFQQAGFQVSDFAVQVGGGTSAIRAASQQAPQLIQAVQLMGLGADKTKGKFGSFLGFLAGPWGVGLTVAVSIVGALATTLMEAEKAAKDVEFASSSLSDAQSILGNVMDLTTGKINTQSEALYTLARAQAVAGRIEARRQQAEARNAITDIRKGSVELQGGIGGGVRFARVGDGYSGGLLRDLQEGVVSVREAEQGLRSFLESGSITEQQYLDAAQAVTSLGVAAENIKVFEDLESALDGNTAAVGRFLNVSSKSTRSTREKKAALTDAEKAIIRQTKETDDYIERLELEVSKIGLSAGQLRQLEIERAKDAAATEDQRQKLDGLNVAREEALSIEEREQTLIKERKQADSLRAGQGARLDQELELFGLTGAARARAAVEMDRMAEKALADTQELKDAIDEIADKEIQLINLEEEQDRLADLAGLYEDLFTNGVDSVWDSFKRQGIAAISQLAAEWTLGLISGQGVNPAGGGAMNRNPLGSIFSSVFGGAANDNQPGGGISKAAAKSAGVLPGDQPDFGGFPDILGSGAGATPLGMYAAGVTIANFLGEGIEKLTGLEYSKTGGMFGGLLGGFIVGALKSTKRGSAIIGGTDDGLGITGFYGNSQDRKDQASGLAGSVFDGINRIAEALGATVDSSRGKVSIGVRDDSINVDPQGRGYTKTSKFKDIRAFGQDAEAAIAFAIQNLIEDGVIGGISAASQRILKSGQDLEAAIEKAVLIESIPKLLKEREDPLGAAIDGIDERFQKLADALREGQATAQQFADAEKLYNLERQDALEQFGRGAEQLEQFLQGLAFGSNSPLSIRQQLESARAEFAQYEQAIAAGESIDQAAFTGSAQAVLGLSRQANASTSAFFDDFNRIRDLTEQAITNSETDALTDGSVVFMQQTAGNTESIAQQQEETNRLLRQIVEQNGGGFAGNGEYRGGFMDEVRRFAN